MNQQEINSIRELAVSHVNSAAKLESYAAQCQDEDIKTMFETSAKSARKGARTLTNLL